MINKKKYIVITIAILNVSLLFSQVRFVNTTTHTTVANSSAFIDASSIPTLNAKTNVGKGLAFPRTDLKAFTAFSGLPVGIPQSFPNFFDGMIVYNTATSGAAGVGATQGILSPGFWYYENKSTTLNGGTWKPLGGGSASPSTVNILPTETATNTFVDGQQVYAIKGTFTTAGTLATIQTPAALPTISKIYGITIFDPASNNSVYARSFYSFDLAAKTFFTGQPGMSVTYPALATGEAYSFILEYFK